MIKFKRAALTSRVPAQKSVTPLRGTAAASSLRKLRPPPARTVRSAAARAHPPARARPFRSATTAVTVVDPATGYRMACCGTLWPTRSRSLVAVLQEGGNPHDLFVRRTGRRAGDGSLAAHGSTSVLVYVSARDGWAVRETPDSGLHEGGREHEYVAEGRAANLSELP